MFGANKNLPKEFVLAALSTFAVTGSMLSPTTAQDGFSSGELPSNYIKPVEQILEGAILSIGSIYDPNTRITSSYGEITLFGNIQTANTNNGHVTTIISSGHCRDNGQVFAKIIGSLVGVQIEREYKKDIFNVSPYGGSAFGDFVREIWGDVPETTVVVSGGGGGDSTPLGTSFSITLRTDNREYKVIVTKHDENGNTTSYRIPSTPQVNRLVQEANKAVETAKKLCNIENQPPANQPKGNQPGINGKVQQYINTPTP